jgi:hypothetical protein
MDVFSVKGGGVLPTGSKGYEEEKGHICFNALDSNGDNRGRFNWLDQNGDSELTHEEYHDSLGHGAPKREQETD